MSPRASRAAAVALLAAAAALAGALPGPAAAKEKPLAAGERVDVNHAPVEELMRLPGIGRKRAEAIAALRDRRPFRRAEDVAQVKGISAAWVARHRALLEVGAVEVAVRGAPAARATAKP